MSGFKDATKPTPAIVHNAWALSKSVLGRNSSEKDFLRGLGPGSLDEDRRIIQRIHESDAGTLPIRIGIREALKGQGTSHRVVRTE